MIVIAMSGMCAFAVESSSPGMRYVVQRPTISFVSGQASCKVIITASGMPIEATLELWQGSTLIASWTDDGTGVLILSGTASVVSGLTYTLTVSGTINGVEFTPCSVTKTA